MADRTSIEWTDATWNPIVGCSVLSPGCTNCYAMRLAGTRLKHVASRIGLTTESKAGPVWTGETRFDERALLQPLRWRRPRKIFVCAHSDPFHPATPDEWIDRVFAVMALCPQHTFQCLTKRSKRMRSYFNGNALLRIAALVYNARHDKGTHIAFERAVRDWVRRINLEDREAAWARGEAGRGLLSWCDDFAMPARSGGISDARRLSTCDGEDRWGEDRRGGASNSVDAFQRCDSAGPDYQPQEREEGRQQPGKFRTCNDVGATSPCSGGSQRQSHAPEGQQASKDKAHRSRRFGNTGNAPRRNDGDGHCRRLQDEAEGYFRDLRPEDVAPHLTWPLPNVWLGVSVEDQTRADERIPELLATPAAVRFVSAEPLLAPLDLTAISWGGDFICGSTDALRGIDTCLEFPGEPRPSRGKIDWVIVGGESGAGARPMHPDWARSLRDQCGAAGVPFFFKQWGEWIGVPDLRLMPGGGGPGFGVFDHCDYDRHREAVRVGKTRAGRNLDGVEHNDFPEG